MRTEGDVDALYAAARLRQTVRAPPLRGSHAAARAAGKSSFGSPNAPAACAKSPGRCGSSDRLSRRTGRRRRYDPAGLPFSLRVALPVNVRAGATATSNGVFVRLMLLSGWEVEYGRGDAD